MGTWAVNQEEPQLGSEETGSSGSFTAADCVGQPGDATGQWAAASSQYNGTKRLLSLEDLAPHLLRYWDPSPAPRGP